MKAKKTNEQCTIVQIENGYSIRIGAECSGHYRETYVFQSFTEMINFLNQYFDFRNNYLLSDYQNQTSINLNNQ